jgi:predicted ATP-dependent serine protease
MRGWRSWLIYIFAYIACNILLSSTYGFTFVRIKNHVNQKSHDITLKLAKGSKEIFFCGECGVEYAKWVGKCTSCQSWNTVKNFRESKVTSLSLDKRTSWVTREKIGNVMIPLGSVNLDIETERIRVFSNELNRLLGGGLVKGSIVLLAGEPGIGKSTLVIQIACNMGTLPSNQDQQPVVYISG